MTFDYTFGLDLPELKEIISTKQFELSEELMDLRFKLGLTEEQMAKIIQIPIQDYLSMEFGLETIPIDRYESALSKMKEYAMLEKIAKIGNVYHANFFVSEKQQCDYKLNLFDYVYSNNKRLQDISKELQQLLTVSSLHLKVPKSIKIEHHPFKDSSKTNEFRFRESFNLQALFNAKQKDEKSFLSEEKVINI